MSSNEIQNPEQNPDNEELLKDCPFEVGQLVQIRSPELKRAKYRNFTKQDLGVVIKIKLQDKATVASKTRFMITVFWQRRQQSCKFYDYRLKKAK
jgi:hypothetical protein